MADHFGGARERKIGGFGYEIFLQWEKHGENGGFSAKQRNGLELSFLWETTKEVQRPASFYDDSSESRRLSCVYINFINLRFGK